MGSLLLFAVKVCLIVGSVAKSENAEEPMSAILFPDEVNLQQADGTIVKSADLSDKSTAEITAFEAAAATVDNRNIIEAPARPCQRCYRRDGRGVCRKIVGCSRDTGNRNIIDAPARPCQPCYRRDGRGVCRKIVGCQS